MDSEQFQSYLNLTNGITTQNNVWSAEQAQKQMDFQERMSNTAHQREVMDLKLAGLNPVLSAGGNGASSPSGAMGDTDHSGANALMGILSTILETDSARALAELNQSAISSRLAARMSGSSSASSYSKYSNNTSENVLWNFIDGMIDPELNLYQTAQNAGKKVNDYVSSGQAKKDVNSVLDKLKTSVNSVVNALLPYKNQTSHNSGKISENTSSFSKTSSAGRNSFLR